MNRTARRALGALATSMAVTLIGAPSASACGALEPVLAHFDSAHLERSPMQQAGDAAAADEYAELHTVWLESIASSALDPFITHFNGAHLERSPGQQAQDAANPDQYVLAHTVLVEAMLMPGGDC